MNYLLRAAGDYCVDRRSVKAQQCVQPSLTNCPLTSFFKFFLEHIYAALLKHSPNNLVGVKKFVRSKRYQRVVGAFGGGVHLFPFRTEQLSPPAPMVLGQMSRESRSVPTQINKMPRCLRTAGHSCLVVSPTLSHQQHLAHTQQTPLLHQTNGIKPCGIFAQP